MKAHLNARSDLHPVVIMIGEVVRQRRERLGWTQEHLALKSGLSTAEVHLVETHQRDLKLSTVIAFGKGFDTHWIFLLIETLLHLP